MKTHNSIKTLKDLHLAMETVQVSIEKREALLQNKIKQVPGEILKSALESLLPFLAGNQLVSGAFKIGKSLFSFITGSKSTDETNAKHPNWKEELASGAQKIGLFTAFKLLYQLWKSK